MKYIQITFAALIVIPVFVLSVFIGIIPSAILRGLGAVSLSERWNRINAIGISRTILFTLGSRVRVYGEEHIPPQGSRVCYVVNHQSMLDIPVLIAYARVWAGFIAKKELRSVPILNFWIQSMHCVYIDRTSPRSAIDAIFKGVDNIRKGVPMVIFPEGTRSRTGTLGEFKPGSLKLATRSKALIVPITIDGTRYALESRRGIGFPRVNLTIAEPIDTASLNEEQMKSLSDTVFKAIEKGQRRAVPGE